MVQDTIAAAGNVRRILKAHSKQIDGELVDYLGGMVVEVWEFPCPHLEELC